MPPPPPNFVPPNHLRRRRPLDPTRHLKSRELWNAVRYHAHPSQTSSSSATPAPPPSSTTTPGSNSWEYYKALTKAILYEIQPFRIKPCIKRIRMFVVEEGGLKQLVFIMVGYVTFAITLLKHLFTLVYRFWKEMDVQAVKSTIQNNKQIAIRSLGGFAGLYVYYSFLVYIHELLHAGLIVFIITLLVLLYTIGLGDNTGANSGIPSAYSVFNRGMHRILGTVDAEELARQYAGGVMAARAGGGGGGMGRNNDFNDEGAWVQEDVEEEDEQDVVQERRRRRRLERLQRRNDNDDILVAETCKIQTMSMLTTMVTLLTEKMTWKRKHKKIFHSTIEKMWQQQGKVERRREGETLSYDEKCNVNDKLLWRWDLERVMLLVMEIMQC
eukprot:g2216.t1 g2216   contig11:957059-958210(-)